MNIQTISLSKVASTSVRANGFSSTQFKAATWRGDDLLVQMKNGEVLVLKGANAKRLSTPEFFLVFDDTSLPLASFAPGMDQPVANKAPHVPPFEVAAPVKVGKLPQGGNKAKGAASADDNPADEAWADQALAITNAGANTAAPEASVSTSSVPLVDKASTAPAASTTHTTSAEASAAAETTASVGSSLWGWPAVALGMGGAVALSHGGGSAAVAFTPSSAGTVSGLLVLGPVTNGKDLLVTVYDANGKLLGADTVKDDGSYTVLLDRAPATGVIRVVVTPVSGNPSGKFDYVGEDGMSHDLLNPVSALTTFEAGKTSTVNVTHYTDLLARKLVPNAAADITMTAAEVKAASVAFAKALGVTNTDTPIEQLTPKPTVDASGKATATADLYGQLLKAAFDQVQTAQNAASTDKAKAADDVLNTLANAISLAPADANTGTPSVSVAPELGKVVLAAKVADYAAAVKADSSSAAAAAKAPSMDDFQAAGIPVTTPEAAKAVSAAAAAAAVNAPTPAGAPAPSLVETVANAATEAVAAQNKAPTAVTLTTALTGNNIAEVPNSGSTTARTKVADMAATDDGLGTNTYTLGGADAAKFEVDGNALYLKAGTALDFETKASYTVTVAAQDSSVAGSAATPAVTYTLNVTNVNEVPTANGTVAAVTAVKGSPMSEVDLSTKFADVDAGDTRTYSLKAGSVLPEGLTLDSHTGKISGTPTALTTGASHITVVATDAGGLKAEQSFDITVNALNHAPTGADKAVAATEDVAYTFSVADFGFADAAGENNALKNVIITQLPAVGSLKLDGTDVTAPRSFTPAEVAKLTYIAAPNANGNDYAALKFTVQDDGGTANGGADTSTTPNTLTFNVAAVNDLPSGDVTITGTGTGTAKVGQTLTAANTLADVDGIPTAGATGAISYQWQAGGVDITDATGETLLLTSAQAGKAITVKASYTDNGGTPESKTSDATGLVELPAPSITDVKATYTLSAFGGTMSGVKLSDLDFSKMVSSPSGLGTNLSFRQQKNNDDGSITVTMTSGVVPYYGTTTANYTEKITFRQAGDSVSSTFESLDGNYQTAEGGKWSSSVSSPSAHSLTGITTALPASHLTASQTGMVNGTLVSPLQAGMQVQVLDGSTVLGNATVSTDGLSWSYTDNRSTDRSANYTAKVLNSEGVAITGASNSYSVTYDTTPPGNVTLALTTGEDATLYPAETGVDVVVTYTGAKSGDSVQLKLAGSNLGAAHTLSDAEVADGKATLHINRADLGADGLKNVIANVMDAAGNTGTSSTPLALTVDPTFLHLLATHDDAGAVTGDVSTTVTRIAPASGTSTADNRISISPTVAGDMTVEGWFKTDAASAFQQVFWMNGMELFLKDGSLSTWAGSDAGSNNNVPIATVDTNWHHYALTTDGNGNWKVWMDGVEVKSRAGGTIDSTPAAQTILVGAHSNITDRALKGDVSNLQVWDSQRTAEQIAQDMHSLYLGGKDSTGTVPTGLVGAWTLGASTSNQVIGGASGSAGSASSSETVTNAFALTYNNDDTTPTLSGTLNVALSSGQSLVVLDGSTEVPATLTMSGADNLTWSLTPTTALSAGAHDLTVKIKDTSNTYIAAAKDVLHVLIDAPSSGIAPPPVIDTSVPAWISASAYQVETPVVASLANPGSYAQGMGSIISNDVGVARSSSGELLGADETMASWLGMTDNTNTQRKTGADMTGPLMLSFAFQNPGALYKDTGGAVHTTEQDMVYTEAEKAFVRSVFDQFAAVSNVVFTENQTQDYLGADLRLFKGTGQALSTVGQPLLPPSVMGFAVQPTAPDSTAEDTYGNLFLVTDAQAYPKDGTAFTTAYGAEKSTVTHELGHAMGLDHPFKSDTNTLHWFGDTDPAGLDTNRLGVKTGGSYDNPQTDAPQETIMTYLSPFGGVIPVMSTQPGYAPIATDRYSPIDLGVYDIAALQHLYGANMSYKTGDNTYSFDSNTPVFTTIWDAKGNDTLQQVGDLGAVIDLRGGEHMSRMGLFTSFSASFSKQGLEDAFATSGFTAKVKDFYGVYTDDAGTQHHVGLVRLSGDTYTYYADPLMPANHDVTLKADVDYYSGDTLYNTQFAQMIAASDHPEYDPFHQEVGGVNKVGVPDASMAYNIGIAFGVVIEDAIGGDGNDVIWGNAAANTIITGAGKDVVEYDTAANINGDTILDFSADDKINLTALGLSSTDSLNWDSGTHKLSYVDTSIPANSWALTIQGVFNKQSQLVIHA